MNAKDRFVDALQTLQEEQREYVDRLWQGEGERDQAQLSAPRPSRPAVRYSDLFKRVPVQPVRTIALTSTVPADPPSSLSVWAAVKAAAAARVQSVAGAVGFGTALSNTAVKFTVHWADVTVFGQVDEVLMALADEYVPDYCGLTDDARSYFEDLGETRRYGKLYKGPGGLVLKGENRIGPSHVSIEIPGGAFDLYGMAPFQRLMQRLNQLQLRWHLTRVDCAFDGVPFTPDHVYRAVERGNVRSLAQRDTLNRRETPFGDEAGKTTYFGRKGSADHLRCYDRRDTGTRIEHECRKARAKWIGLIFMTAPIRHWHHVALGELRDFLDFVRRKAGENVTRNAGRLLVWWGRFIGAVQRSEVKMSDVLKGFQQQAELTAGKVAAAVKAVSRRVNAVREVLATAAKTGPRCGCPTCGVSAGDRDYLGLLDKFRVRENGADRVRAREWGDVLTRASDLLGESVEAMITTAAGLRLIPSLCVT